MLERGGYAGAWSRSGEYWGGAAGREGGNWTARYDGEGVLGVGRYGGKERYALGVGVEGYVGTS